MVSTQGFNALLKLVEEPPEHLRFIFATTEPEKVIPTIRSRTHHYPFRLIPPRLLSSYLSELCDKEGVADRAGGAAARGARRRRVGPRLPLGARPADRRRRRRPGSPTSWRPGCSATRPTRCSTRWSTRSPPATERPVFGVVDKVIETGQDPRRFTEDLLRRLRDLVIVAAVPGRDRVRPHRRLRGPGRAAGRAGGAVRRHRPEPRRRHRRHRAHRDARRHRTAAAARAASAPGCCCPAPTTPPSGSAPGSTGSSGGPATSAARQRGGRARCRTRRPRRPRRRPRHPTRARPTPDRRAGTPVAEPEPVRRRRSRLPSRPRHRAAAAAHAGPRRRRPQPGRRTPPLARHRRGHQAPPPDGLDPPEPELPGRRARGHVLTLGFTNAGARDSFVSQRLPRRRPPGRDRRGRRGLEDRDHRRPGRPARGRADRHQAATDRRQRRPRRRRAGPDADAGAETPTTPRLGDAEEPSPDPDASAPSAAREAIQETRPAGAEAPRPTTWPAADAEASRDDLDADAETLGGEDLLARELGAPDDRGDQNP